MTHCKNSLLTIAIPTFNRNQILVKNLEILLPGLSDWVELLVVDNCSEVPVSDSLSVLRCAYPDKKITIHRNSVNIGANSNILRCIEQVKSKYIWIIGDDDFIDTNILRSIYDKINLDNPVWINLCEDISKCQPVRSKALVCKSLSEFLAELKSINE